MKSNFIAGLLKSKRNSIKEKNNNKNENNDNKAFYWEIFKVASPIAVQGGISACLGLLDSLMVGFLGERELAAVGIAMQIFFIHYLLLFGFIGGTATFAAQYYGKRDKEAIRKTIGFCTFIAFIIGIIFFIIGYFFPEIFLKAYVKDSLTKKLAVSYMKIGSFTFFSLAISGPLEMGLKATQQTKAPMFISSLAFGLNTLLNYILIFGKFGLPEMGIEGAALATVLCRILEAVLSLAYVSYKKNYFRGKLTSYMSWDYAFAKPIIKNSIPTSINDFLWSTGQSLYVAAFSRIGVFPYAAYQMAASVMSIFNYVAMSLSDTILIIVGEELGKGNKEKAYNISKKLLKISFLICIVIGILGIIFGRKIIELYTVSLLCKKVGIKIIIVLAITLPISQLVQMFKVGISRSGGDTKFAMILDSSFVWLVGVPFAFLVSEILGFPIYFAVLSIKLLEIIEIGIFYYRYKSKKWLKDLV